MKGDEPPAYAPEKSYDVICLPYFVDWVSFLIKSREEQRISKYPDFLVKF